MAEDYYATLGVSRTASAEEIQKAYRTLARKHHPDLNQDDPKAKEKFQKVQTAFDVLNDPKKRESFDRFGAVPGEGGGFGPGGGPQGWPGGGPQGWSGGGPNVDVNFEDLFGAGDEGGGGTFADLFKQFGKRGRGAGGSRGPRPSRGADLEHELHIPFATSITGGEAQIAVRRGDGKTEEIRVKIPAGIDDGKRIRLRGQGEPGIGGAPAGDILIRVWVAPHPQYRRHGKRLEMTLPITLAEALGGAKIDVPTPHGTITLTVPPGSSSGAKLRVKGHGVRTRDGEAGDLFAELEIVLPPGMSDEDRRQLTEIAAHYDYNPRGDLRW